MYTPCRDCTTRKLGCHATCENYAKYRKIIDDRRNAAYSQKKAYGEYRGYRRDMMIKISKNK